VLLTLSYALSNSIFFTPFGAAQVQIPSSFQLGMSQAATGSGGVLRNGHSDKMFCGDCFLARGDGEFTYPCQNPRCHFYSYGSNQSGGGVLSSEIPSPSFSPAFNREVGHDHKGKCVLGARQLPGKDKVSRSEPLFPGDLGAMTVQKAPTGASSSMNIQRLLSGRDPLVPNKGTPGYYSHMMSLPEYADPYLEKAGRDLVEDSTSLLARYERGEERVSCRNYWRVRTFLF
jgi:hypothetical protein